MNTNGNQAMGQFIQNFIDNHPEAVVALLALFVSIVSIYQSIKSLKIQREHNEKSVRPIGRMIFSDYEDYIAIKIKNAGVGPLILKNLSVLNSKKEIKNNIIEWMPQIPLGMSWSHFSKPTDVVISQNATLSLLELQGKVGNKSFEDFRDKVRRALKELTIELEYMDIYEKQMPIVKRELSWFGRHIEKNNQEHAPLPVDKKQNNE
jgi:hypothetical protein